MPLRVVAKKFMPRTPPAEAVAGILSMLVGVTLLGVKFLAYYLTGSASIFSDAMESIVNVLASAFALFALFYAHQPADENHPYGHGKIEFLSAGFEGGMILLAAMVMVFRAVELMVRGPKVEQIHVGLWLMMLAMVVNGAMGIFLIRRGRKANSVTLEADGRHLLTDAVTSGAAITALLIVKASGWAMADPIVALLIAAWVTFTAVGLLRRSAAGLMDQQDVRDEKLLQRILDSHLAPHGKPPLICSYHKLAHRHSGRYVWVEYHMVIRPDLTVEEGHAIASAIEYEIEQAFGDEADATAHMEPCVDGACGHGVCAEEEDKGTRGQGDKARGEG